MQEKQSVDNVLDSKEKKLAFFQNLIIVAAADKVLDNDEGNLLLTVGERLGLTPEEVMPIADNLSTLSFIIPAEGMQKTFELQTLVQMMTRDGHIHDREYSLCLEYANRIGYAKELLDNMIERFTADNSGN